MPKHYARRLTSPNRTPSSDRHLGCILAAIAGASNAIGFGVLRHYTSHMTGMVSTLGERMVSGDVLLSAAAAVAIATFLFGAACCTVMVREARRRGLDAAFALPLLLESLLLLLVALVAPAGPMASSAATWATIGTLTFAMGLQNALITKISRGEIRTTHVTGIVTDLGIEFGRGWASWPDGGSQTYGRQRAGLLAALLVSFIAGSVLGTLGARVEGRLAFLPPSLALAVVALVPAVDDLGRWRDTHAG